MNMFLSGLKQVFQGGRPTDHHYIVYQEQLLEGSESLM